MKIKFPILAKVLVLGSVISLFAASVSIVVSNSNQVARSKKELINNIDNSLLTFYYTYQEMDGYEDRIANLLDIKEYINEGYEKNKDVKLQQFESFSDFETHFKEEYPWIYPKPGDYGTSLPKLQFTTKYAELSNTLIEGSLTSGTTAAYVAYRDGDNLVFMADSRRESSTRGANDFYQVPGSHYTIKPEDILINNTEEAFYGYNLDGYLTRFVPINLTDEEGKTTEVASFFIEYDLNRIQKENRQTLISEIIILSSTTVFLIIIYAIFAYVLFVRNINKLSKESNKISNQLANGETLSLNKITVNSNDEIKALATSFERMQVEIINYTEIVKRDIQEKEHNRADLEIAQKIQMEALPDTSYQDKNVSISAIINPAKEVGGDFYDYFYIGNKLIITIADVSGKGVPAALFMMKAKDTLKNNLLHDASLLDSINMVNQSLYYGNKANLFVTAFVGVIDFDKNEFRYVNAGHERPYIIRKGKVEKLECSSNFVLGLEKGFPYVLERRPFEKGDIFFLFTDGLNESINLKNEEFGYERIVKSLEQANEGSLDTIKETVLNNLETFKEGTEPFDDVTMLIVRPQDNTLHLSYDKKDYSIIEDMVNKLDERFPDLDENTKSKAGIIIDELVNNLVSYDQTKDLVINLDVALDKDRLILQISSNGNDYDIIENHVDKYASGSEDQNLVGGFGISIVKKISESARYEYVDGHTLTTVVLKKEAKPIN